MSFRMALCCFRKQAIPSFGGIRPFSTVMALCSVTVCLWGMSGQAAAPCFPASCKAGSMGLCLWCSQHDRKRRFNSSENTDSGDSSHCKENFSVSSGFAVICRLIFSIGFVLEERCLGRAVWQCNEPKPNMFVSKPAQSRAWGTQL